MNQGIETVFSALLVLGATVNLAAGARRPMVEHAILRADHYAHADRAAAAALRLVPREAPLHIVVYDGDMLDELDAAVWFDYRAKWLLYPRKITVSRVSSHDPLKPAPIPGTSSGKEKSPPYLDGSFVLFFRASKSPILPDGKLERLAEGPMWVLARREGPGPGSGG